MCTLISSEIADQNAAPTRENANAASDIELRVDTKDRDVILLTNSSLRLLDISQKFRKAFALFAF